MRVIVTGGHGFIGRHAALALAREGHDVAVVGRAEWDPAAPATLRPAGEGGPFALVHLAWDTARPPHYAAHAACVLDLARLCDYWGPRGLRRVVAAGTAEEYGQRAGVLAEAEPPAGDLTPYGWGKAAAREMLRAWSARAGVPAAWLRPFVVYGPGQAGAMALPYALRQLRAGLPAEFTDGRQRRDFVHVADVADALAAAVAAPLEGFQVFNVGTGRPAEVREVLEHLRAAAGGGEFRFGAIPRRAGEPDVQAADTRRAGELLGWRAAVDWRDGIARLAAA